MLYYTYSIEEYGLTSGLDTWQKSLLFHVFVLYNKALIIYCIVIAPFGFNVVLILTNIKQSICAPSGSPEHEL